EGLRDLAADLVGDADHAHVEHRRVSGEFDLDLFRSDAVGRALDDVVLARYEPEIAVVIHVHKIARPVPAVLADGMALLVRIAPVDGPGRSPGHEVANVAG